MWGIEERSKAVWRGGLFDALGVPFREGLHGGLELLLLLLLVLLLDRMKWSQSPFSFYQPPAKLQV
jgi:hypothetical protein